MTGNRTIDLALVALSSLVAIALLAMFYYTENIYQKPLPSDGAQLEKLIGDSLKKSLPNTYKMDEMIINLPSDTARLRFLKVQMHFVPFGEADLSLFEQNKPRIQDIIIDITSKMEPSQLNTVSGKILLEDRLRRNINTAVKKKAVKEVYFAEFVVQ